MIIKINECQIFITPSVYLIKVNCIIFCYHNILYYYNIGFKIFIIKYVYSTIDNIVSMN